MLVKQCQAAPRQPYAILIMHPLGGADNLFQPFTQQQVSDVMHNCSLRLKSYSVPLPWILYYTHVIAL
ncbi:MAG: hypothetical protein M3R66_07775, partial [Actinomycetota bacterium]|nr:hypothetical protein [Actinomycetota bacterium]